MWRCLLLVHGCEPAGCVLQKTAPQQTLYRGLGQTRRPQTVGSFYHFMFELQEHVTCCVGVNIFITTVFYLYFCSCLRVGQTLGSPTFLKLWASVRLLSNSNSYVFDTDSQNNVIYSNLQDYGVKTSDGRNCSLCLTLWDSAGTFTTIRLYYCIRCCCNEWNSSVWDE